MKTFFFAVLLLISTPISAQAQQTIGDTIYREGDVFVFLNNIENDTLLMLERMAAFHFHELINQYRESKKRKTMYWDDKLWLAARNHTVFISQNLKGLSHNQAKSKPYFTGSKPENRVDYVTYNSNEFEFDGYENVASTGEVIPETMDLRAFEGLSLEELIEEAKAAADEMFDIWKHSTGHNQNMLESNHLAHGTCFIFCEEAVYGCSVFTQKQKYYAPDTIDISFLGANVASFEHLFEENGQDFEAFPKGLNRVEYKLFASLTHAMNSKSIEADKHLYKLVDYETDHPNDSRSTKKKFFKVTNQLGRFRLMGHDLNKLEQHFSMSSEDFYSLVGVEKMEDFIAEKGSLISNAKGWGGLVKVAPKNGEFEVIITIYTITKK